MHRSPLVNGELALLYSAAIRENGDKYGKILGVLGIIFKYAALAQTIVENTPLSKEERLKKPCMHRRWKGLVLADSAKRNLEDTLDFRGKHELLENKKDLLLRNIKIKLLHRTRKGAWLRNLYNRVAFIDYSEDVTALCKKPLFAYKAQARCLCHQGCGCVKITD